MSTITCLHPNCSRLMTRGRHCCRNHWFQLPEELRASFRDISDYELSELRQVVVDHFNDCLIGDHEIVKCRGKDCGADIVWLVTKRGKNIAVGADAVEPGDDKFEYGRHVAHFTVCPNADDFRKRA